MKKAVKAFGDALAITLFIGTMIGVMILCVWGVASLLSLIAPKSVAYLIAAFVPFLLVTWMLAYLGDDEDRSR